MPSGAAPLAGTGLAIRGSERDASEPPILICMLGDFRLLKAGRPITVRSGGKSEALLADLALRRGYSASRESLLATLWPESDAALAAQSLNSLVYSLHKLLGDAIGGSPPVLGKDGRYRLNAEAGVGVDVASFERLANTGDHLARAGDPVSAISFYNRAVALYHGDLSVGIEIAAIVERERLRGLYLTLLARLADERFGDEDYGACLDHALRLLTSDPCREDAHRLVMRCYVRRGERAQALRQYRLCEQILRAEFDAAPEPATQALFRQVRLDPAGV